MSTVAAKPQRLGELIQYYRQKKELSLSKLQEAVGIDKGSLSRIENSEVKRPDFQSILSIAAVLDIPHDAIVEQYIEIGHKSEVIYTILQNELTTLEHPSLIPKIAAKFLEAPNEDSLDAVEKLYHTVDSIDHAPTQLSLFNLIVNYSRAHGIMPYIAKGLFRKYMIERNDFSRLKETYQSGKYILDYADFLNDSEKVTINYSLAVHAYSLMFYDDSIKFSEYVIKHDKGKYKPYAINNIIFCYYNLKRFEESEQYLEEYKQFDLPCVIENSPLFEGFISEKTGNINLCLNQLNDYLKHSSEYNLVYVVSELFSLHIQANDPDSALQLLDYEEKMVKSLQDIRTTPDKRAKLADFYQLAGNILLEQSAERAFDYYLKSFDEYLKIGLYEKAFESITCINQAIIDDASLLDIELVKKINSMYMQAINKKLERVGVHEEA
ncbi:helix-turn-helix domain-containing protein [Paenibacillus thiaminolyticus]|uniref:helix-turn-helix domain-containing protein n=1 Tax=Paenibacillus thiaminolyticus TaxID=49283 RepID=UPI0025429B6A|nr:helix-turn-helix transcriptional regulator [Paenibacillus thiaminolyticus]WII40077.1 helix-turn-helix transcriptional regulator [Paenibacillus thiaminolyticus]